MRTRPNSEDWTEYETLKRIVRSATACVQQLRSPALGEALWEWGMAWQSDWLMPGAVQDTQDQFRSMYRTMYCSTVSAVSICVRRVMICRLARAGALVTKPAKPGQWQLQDVSKRCTSCTVLPVHAEVLQISVRVQQLRRWEWRCVKVGPQIFDPAQRLPDRGRPGAKGGERQLRLGPAAPAWIPHHHLSHHQAQQQWQ